MKDRGFLLRLIVLRRQAKKHVAWCQGRCSVWSSTEVTWCSQALAPTVLLNSDDDPLSAIPNFLVAPQPYLTSRVPNSSHLPSQRRTLYRLCFEYSLDKLHIAA
jgi:hypothetical protein